MGELGGFLRAQRANVRYRDPLDRVNDVSEFVVARPVADARSISGPRSQQC